MGNEVKIMFFVKFIAKEYQEQFLDGNLFMRDLQYFIDSEKEENKGMADKNEGSMVLNSATINIGDIEIGSLEYEHLSISSDFVKQMPILCLFAIKSSMLIENDNNITERVINFEDGVLEHMKEHFGDNILLIGAKPFLERVESACKSKEISLMHSFVRYFDYSKDDKERMKFTRDIFNPKIAFAKDKFFEAQNEYRFAFPSEKIDTSKTSPNFTLEIGDIRDITYNFKVDELLKLKLKK